MAIERFSETFEMLGPHDEPVKVTVRFEQFPNDPVKYWHSAEAADGQIVEPWKDGTFQKGDGTILKIATFPAFNRTLPIDPLA
ncbi:MAG: hypothetical protein ABI846_11035 [Rudaea sp.]